MFKKKNGKKCYEGHSMDVGYDKNNNEAYILIETPKNDSKIYLCHDEVLDVMRMLEKALEHVK